MEKESTNSVVGIVDGFEIVPSIYPDKPLKVRKCNIYDLYEK